jgi:hypothetical protein
MFTVSVTLSLVALLINLVPCFATGAIQAPSAATIWPFRKPPSVAAASQNTWLISSAGNTRIMKYK